MRIVARLLVLLPLLWVEGVGAVDCPHADYDLNTQAEVDAVGATGCDRVSGGLSISYTDITNLDGLHNITSVGADIRIFQNPTLNNIDGLANLVSVGGDFTLQGGTATHVDGLNKLTSVGGEFDLRTPFTNLNGLLKLESIGGDLVLYSSVAENLDGLSNLTAVGGGVSVGGASLTNLNGLRGLAGELAHLSIGGQALSSLGGLEKVTSISGELRIARTGVSSLAGLNNLRAIGSGYSSIWGNDRLASLDGLEALENIEGWGWLEIYDNPMLENTNGLGNLRRVGGYLRLFRNSRLGDCQALAPLFGWPDGSQNENSIGGITLNDNELGCNSVEEILTSVSGPTRPVITEATTSSNSISLAFTPSTTTDTLFPITGYNVSCTGSDVDISGSPATDLLDNTPIQETLTVTGYDPTSVQASIEVDIDITHSDPTDLYITLTTPEGTELVLWNQGSTGGEDLIGTFPTTLTAVDSLDSVTRQTMDGDWVLSIEDIDVGPIVREGVLNSWGIRITEELARNGSGSPIEVLGATRGRDYTCTVAPVTKLGTTPVSDAYTVSVPLELPSVPTITSTDYEDGKIILTVSVSDNGGTDITGYEATCTDGTNAYTGTSVSSPITVSGLTNDVAYTCKVTATNSVGTSSASAATDPITPEEMSTGLPIWLLYQATQ